MKWIFDFTITPEDIVLMNQQHFVAARPRTSKWTDIARLTGLALGSLIFVGIGLDLLIHRDSGAAAVMFVGAAVIALSAILWRKYGGGAGQFGRTTKLMAGSGFPSASRLEVDESRLRQSTVKGDLALDWGSVNSVVLTKDYVLLAGGGTRGVWLPRSVFATDGDLRGFIEFGLSHAPSARFIESPVQPAHPTGAASDRLKAGMGALLMRSYVRRSCEHTGGTDARGTRAHHLHRWFLLQLAASGRSWGQVHRD